MPFHSDSDKTTLNGSQEIVMHSLLTDIFFSLRPLNLASAVKNRIVSQAIEHKGLRLHKEAKC